MLPADVDRHNPLPGRAHSRYTARVTSTLSSGDDLALEKSAFDVDAERFDLFRAVCLLPRVEGREPHVQHCVERVEQWGASLRRQIGPDAPLHEQFTALCAQLFGALQFDGDTTDYDAPHNSFIVEVLDRRRGLPIALSMLTWATANAAGLRPVLLAQPRHFLTGLTDGKQLIAFDPFNKGARVPVAGAEQDPLVEPSPKEVLTRMLMNLRVSYLRREDREGMLAVLSRLILLNPRVAVLLVERAQLRTELGDFAGALADVDEALRLAPNTDVRVMATQTRRRLVQSTRYLN